MEKVKKFFKNQDWVTLRGLGKSRLVSLTLAVPALGYVILLSDKLVEYFVLSDELVGGGQPLFLLKLRLIYLGLMVISIAQLIFSWKCPTLVKIYENEADYTTREGAYIQQNPKERVRFADQCIEEFSTLTSSSSYVAEYSSFLSELKQRQKPDRSEAWRSYNNGDIWPLNQLMVLQYRVSRMANHAWVIVTWFLYALGFALLGIPSVETFFRVIINFF